MKECITHHYACDCREAGFETLLAFARDVMRSWPDGGLDGGELQDIALRHGLIEPSKPTQEERDEWGLDNDDHWYRKTAVLSPNNGGKP